MPWRLTRRTLGVVMNRQSIGFLGLLLLTVVGLSACKRDKHLTGIFTRKPEPSVNGTWTGALNTASATASLSITIVQDTLNIRGTYTAPSGQASVFGTEGRVDGVTTGESFLMTLDPDDAACPADIDLSGTNDGSEMEFSFSGVDCASAAYSGQGYFTKN